MQKIMHRIGALAAAAALCAGAALSVRAADNGVGTVTEKGSSTPAPGVTVKQLEAMDGSTKQNIHTLTFDMKKGGYTVLPYFGDDLFSRHTLTEMAAHAAKNGYEVVGGINGDFFNVDDKPAHGMPVGPVIQNGRVICSEDKSPNITQDKESPWRTIGFRRNGTAVIGHLKVTKSINIVHEDGTTRRNKITLLNRKLSGYGIYAFTSDFGDTVNNNNPKVVTVTLSVKQGDMRLDETTVCTVDAVSENVKKAPIPEGKIVLAAFASSQSDADLLRGLKKGQRIDISLSGGPFWKDVFHAISGPDAVLKSGAVASTAFVKATNYPSTLVGTKGDGTVVMVQVDGRNVGGSHGFSVRQAGQYMKSLGCTDALLFDGGGSSEMVAGKPGNIQVLNNPSDGEERRIGTCLLVVEKNKAFTDPAPIKPAPPFKDEPTTTPGTDAPTAGNQTGTTAPAVGPADPDAPTAADTTAADPAVTDATRPGETGLPTEKEPADPSAQGTRPSSDAPAENAEAEETADGLSGGAVAAIVIAVLAAVCGGGAAVYVYLKKKK